VGLIIASLPVVLIVSLWKGVERAVPLVLLSFLFWSWVFGFVGALLAIPATLLVKALLQERQETHFLKVLLSGKDEGNAGSVSDDTWGEAMQGKNKVR
jgi:hypothetical protein